MRGQYKDYDLGFGVNNCLYPALPLTTVDLARFIVVLCLSRFNCKIRVMINLSFSVVGKVKQDYPCGVLETVLVTAGHYYHYLQSGGNKSAFPMPESLKGQSGLALSGMCLRLRGEKTGEDRKI